MKEYVYRSAGGMVVKVIAFDGWQVTAETQGSGEIREYPLKHFAKQFQKVPDVGDKNKGVAAC